MEKVNEKFILPKISGENVCFSTGESLDER